MIIIINGSLEVGKSTIAEEFHFKFDKSVNLVGNYIEDLNPFEICDEARITNFYHIL